MRRYPSGPLSAPLTWVLWIVVSCLLEFEPSAPLAPRAGEKDLFGNIVEPPRKRSRRQ